MLRMYMILIKKNKKVIKWSDMDKQIFTSAYTNTQKS